MPTAATPTRFVTQQRAFSSRTPFPRDKQRTEVYGAQVQKVPPALGILRGRVHFSSISAIWPAALPALLRVWVTLVSTQWKIAELYLVRDGLTVGRRHFEREPLRGNDEVGAHMRVHPGRCAGREDPVVNGSAGLVRGDGGR